LKWGDYSGLSSWALNAITCFFIRERQREIGDKIGEGTQKGEREAEGNWRQNRRRHTEGRRQCEDRSRDWSSASTIKKCCQGGKEQTLPQSLWRKHGSANISISAQETDLRLLFSGINFCRWSHQISGNL